MKAMNKNISLSYDADNDDTKSKTKIKTKKRNTKGDNTIDEKTKDINDFGVSSINDVFKNTGIVVIKKNKKTIRPNTGRDSNQTTWVDKYRPKTIDNIIGHDKVKEMLSASIKKGDLPHLLFHGGSGTGKTSTVLALVSQLYGPDRMHDNVLELNASDENGINVVREKIIRFANIVVGTGDPKYPSPPFKIIILDEADSMTSEAQTALKKVMETTYAITRFVFICNYESKIIEPIKSRCADFRFNPIPNDLMIDKLKTIAHYEKMNINEDVFKTIADICGGDARRSINTLQNIKYIPGINNRKVTIKDIYDITSYIDKSYIDKYWKKILTTTADDLCNIVTDITSTGYPINYIIKCISDKILDSDMKQKQISRILIYIAKIERMITCGSDNYIQLLSLLAFINGIYKNMKMDDPEIF